MKKIKIRETLLVAEDWSKLCFDIDKAREHFMAVLQDDVFPQDDYSKYMTIEVVIDEGATGWGLEGVRWETDEEFEMRFVLTESRGYKLYLELSELYLELKEKFKDVKDPE